MLNTCCCLIALYYVVITVNITDGTLFLVIMNNVWKKHILHLVFLVINATSQTSFKCSDCLSTNIKIRTMKWQSLDATYKWKSVHFVFTSETKLLSNESALYLQWICTLQSLSSDKNLTVVLLIITYYITTENITHFSLIFLLGLWNTVSTNCNENNEFIVSLLVSHYKIPQLNHAEGHSEVLSVTETQHIIKLNYPFGFCMPYNCIHACWQYMHFFPTQLIHTFHFLHMNNKTHIFIYVCFHKIFHTHIDKHI